MYIPAHFAAHDLAAITAFVDRAGTADLVTFDGTKPVATLLPVIWEQLPRPSAPDGAGASGGYGRLLGHIAMKNSQWSTAIADIPGLAIVRGPQAYISPSWYQSTKEHGRAVPTWNYTAVHFTGKLTFHTDIDWLRDVVTRLTDRYEAGRSERWWVGDAPEKYIEGQLRAIVGVEMAIDQIEAKEKLSQNRTPQDRANVIVALGREPGPQAQEIAGLMAARQDAAG